MKSAGRNSFSANNVLSYIDKTRRELGRLDYVLTIILVGSYARGDYDKLSDMDLLLITSKETSRKELFQELPYSKHRNLVSLHPYSSIIFRALYRNGNLFLRHAVTEGKVLHDNGFYRELRKEPFPMSHKDDLREWYLTKRKLDFYSDPTMFNNLFVDCLSRIYQLACRIAMVASAINDTPEFNKEKAFDLIIERYPESRKEVSALMELRQVRPPNPDSSRRRPRLSADHSSAFVKATLSSLKQVIQKVESSGEFNN